MHIHQAERCIVHMHQVESRETFSTEQPDRIARQSESPSMRGAARYTRRDAHVLLSNAQSSKEAPRTPYVLYLLHLWENQYK